jgi:hypothetical protein
LIQIYRLKNAMNRINAADREKTVAEFEAEASRIRIVAKAKAEAEKQTSTRTRYCRSKKRLQEDWLKVWMY